MKHKKQNSNNQLPKKPKAKENKSPKTKAPLVPTSIVQSDSTVADVALVNRAEATVVARPTLFVHKDKATGLLLALSVQPPMRQDIAGIVEKFFSHAQLPKSLIAEKE